MTSSLLHVYRNLRESSSNFLEILLQNLRRKKKKNNNNNKQAIIKNDMDHRRSWDDELVSCILGDIIVERLNLFHCIRLSNISKSWRSAVIQRKKKIKTAQVPWLVLSPDHHQPRTTSLKFFDFTLGCFGNISLPTTLFGWWYCGSSKGWLVIAKGILYALIIYDDDDSDTDAVETHDHSMRIGDDDDDQDVVVKLIPVDTNLMRTSSLSIIDPLDPNIWVPVDDSEETWMMKNVLLISYLVESNGELLIVHRIMNFMQSMIYLDAPRGVFNEDVKVFIVAVIKVFIINLIIIVMMIIILPTIITVDWARYSIYAIMLFLTTMTTFKLDEDEENGDEDAIIGFDYIQTSKFEVFKIDYPSANNMSVTRLKSLGDRMLFVSKSGSVSVQVSKSNDELKKNCIFFVEEEVENCSTTISRESGIFYLENERIERSLPSKNHMSWFSPNLL
ncbi:hypothetical protein LWI29_026871 [Acer saccharum]|uniref:KIB1-4 beta-propeller domain-containing protein n=1 Tax=Acer saccharum TaxID=4024 RepID=A0AA39RZU6_ACESA|nr:hypothetical protein LWI29_026871 [Acer saccharum]